jgi:hypothetical protein
MPTPPRRLPIRTPPFPNETLRSYTHRVAIANHLPPEEFQDYLRDPVTRRTAVVPERLAAVSGWPLSTLQHALPELPNPGRHEPGSPPGPWPQHPASTRDCDPQVACRCCAAARGATTTVTCWAPSHSTVCVKHRRRLGHREVLQQGSNGQVDLTRLPDVVAAAHRHRNLARRYGLRPVWRAYNEIGLHIALRWTQRRDFGRHRNRRLEILGFDPHQWRFGLGEPVLHAAVYPEAVALTGLVLSPHWVSIAADPRQRPRFYLEAARRLNLADYQPYSAYDPLAWWADGHADRQLQYLTQMDGGMQ